MGNLLTENKIQDNNKMESPIYYLKFKSMFNYDEFLKNCEKLQMDNRPLSSYPQIIDKMLSVDCLRQQIKTTMSFLRFLDCSYKAKQIMDNPKPGLDKQTYEIFKLFQQHTPNITFSTPNASIFFPIINHHKDDIPLDETQPLKMIKDDIDDIPFIGNIQIFTSSNSELNHQFLCSPLDTKKPLSIGHLDNKRYHLTCADFGSSLEHFGRNLLTFQSDMMLLLINSPLLPKTVADRVMGRLRPFFSNINKAEDTSDLLCDHIFKINGESVRVCSKIFPTPESTFYSISDDVKTHPLSNIIEKNLFLESFKAEEIKGLNEEYFTNVIAESNRMSEKIITEAFGEYVIGLYQSFFLACDIPDNALDVFVKNSNPVLLYEIEKYIDGSYNSIKNNYLRFIKELDINGVHYPVYYDTNNHKLAVPAEIMNSKIK